MCLQCISKCCSVLFSSEVMAHILCVNNKAVLTPFNAKLRKEYVREFETDKIDMYESFRLGDIVCLITC